MELFDASLKAVNLALGAAGRRQEVLANNLANVNTPGYKRLDINFEGMLQQAVDAAEEGDSSLLDSLRPEVRTDSSVSMRADGNSVDVDQEMAYLAENNIRYNALVQLASKKLDGLKYVISDGRR